MLLFYVVCVLAIVFPFLIPYVTSHSIIPSFLNLLFASRVPPCFILVCMETIFPVCFVFLLSRVWFFDFFGD